MTSPWAKIQQIEPTNLEDIMSEQVAIDLQAKENKRYEESVNEYQSIVDGLSENATADIPNDDTCESDAVIAMMLQKQFDKEYDGMLKKTEDNINGGCKVSISYNNYRRSNNFGKDSESEEDDDDILDRKDWDRFDNVERSISLIPRCGYRKQEDGNMVTKHDMTLSARKNACKFMSFPPEFHTGDGAGFDLQLSNKVFNSLKLHSRKEQQSKRHRINDKREDRATAELGVDEFTCLLLYKLVNNQLLERVNGVISTGKEAVILHADSDPSYTECVLPKECVVKVFKTILSEFKQRDKYIKDDHRFKDRFGKQNSRKMVQMWAEKEMHNLIRLHKVGLPCPEVVALKKHVLVMSFIGTDHRPASKLKDARLKPVDLILAYDQVVEAMKKMYSEAKLVHADLSEYNILWHDGKCWFIDVGQSVEPTHPNAFDFLFRDCTNISTFFTKRGVPEVKEPRDLFLEITGYDFFDKNSLPAVSNKIKPKPHLVDRIEMQNPSRFDYEWDNSKINDVATNQIISETDKLQLVDAPVA